MDEAGQRQDGVLQLGGDAGWRAVTAAEALELGGASSEDAVFDRRRFTADTHSTTHEAGTLNAILKQAGLK